MSQDTQGVFDEAPAERVRDIGTIPDGSGNDRDPDESETERFDAG